MPPIPAPATNQLQYFEKNGSRALVAGDWKAVCKHDKGADYDTETWELYRLTDDWSECHDLAAEAARRLADSSKLWWKEADRHGVLPLDDRMVELFGARFRRTRPTPPTAATSTGRRCRHCPPRRPRHRRAGVRPHRDGHPGRPGRRGGALRHGHRQLRRAVFVQNDRLVIDYNAFDDHTIIESDIEVPPALDASPAQGARGDGDAGSNVVEVDGAPAGSADLPLLMRMMSSVGQRRLRPRVRRVRPYEAPFAFPGTLHEIVIQLQSPQDLDGASRRSRHRDEPPMIAVTLLGTGSPIPNADRAGPATLVSGRGEPSTTSSMPGEAC